MKPWVAGLIVTGEMICSGCGRVMRHPERYGYICEEGKPSLSFCEDCSRAKGYLQWNADKKMETFLSRGDNEPGSIS